MVHGSRGCGETGASVVVDAESEFIDEIPFSDTCALRTDLVDGCWEHECWFIV
jgi:protein tyrosine phosphatase